MSYRSNSGEIVAEQNTSTATDNWREVRLAQLGRIERGRSRHRPRHAAELYGGPYPFIQTGDIKASGGRITSHRQTYSEAGLAQSRLWPVNTLAITIAANIAETAILTYPACFPDSVVGFVADETKCDVRFVEYVFQHLRSRIQHEHVGTGSVQDNINLQTLDELRFLAPPLAEQQAIAHVLGTLDDKVELNRRMNQTLEEMARAIFRDWFVDFGPTRAKMEGLDPYLPPELWDLFPGELVDSELGGIPEGWEIKRLPELVDYKEGPGIRHWQYTNSNEGTRFINIRCIQDDDILLATANRITDDEADGKYAHFHLKEFDIVVSTSGTLGRSAVVRASHLPLVLNTSVIRFRPIEGATTFSYLYGYIKSAAFMDELEMSASGSVQKNFGPMHLTVMSMLCPPHSIIQRFEQLASPLLRQMVAKRAESDVILIQKNSLLPNLVAGELSVANLGL